MKAIIIIPALNPDHHLLNLIEQFDRKGGSDYKIVVVDDGSDAQSAAVFWRLTQEYGCVVLHHKENRGKGAALKTGFTFAGNTWPGSCGCITVDADGQHSPEDILKMGLKLAEHPAGLLLGTRDFTSPDVPFKSRWGNRITSLLFRKALEIECPDTQTGLRGIPMGLLPLMGDIKGERFEYEMNVLLYAARHGIPLLPVSIATIYRDQNRHSHFRAVHDSLRVYAGFARYGISSAVCATIDLSLFFMIVSILGLSTLVITAATVSARIISGIVNFIINKKWVFRSNRSNAIESGKYLLLFLIQMAASSLFVSLFTPLLGVTAAKLLVDFALFFLSYLVQKRIIFTDKIIPFTGERSVVHD